MRSAPTLYALSRLALVTEFAGKRRPELQPGGLLCGRGGVFACEFRSEGSSRSDLARRRSADLAERAQAEIRANGSDRRRACLTRRRSRYSHIYR